MAKVILSKGNSINAGKSSIKIEKKDLCPECEKQGTLVKNFTVNHMVLDEFIEQVGDNDYFLCMSEECNITYYNAASKMKFTREQVNVPIWFKKDSNPKYACYCSKVTEEQVIDAVLQDGATEMKEVMKITGAMRNSEYQKKNPLGKCCHQIIQDAIDKALSMK